MPLRARLKGFLRKQPRPRTARNIPSCKRRRLLAVYGSRVRRIGAGGHKVLIIQYETSSCWKSPHTKYSKYCGSQSPSSRTESGLLLQSTFPGILSAFSRDNETLGLYEPQEWSAFHASCNSKDVLTYLDRGACACGSHEPEYYSKGSIFLIECFKARELATRPEGRTSLEVAKSSPKKGWRVSLTTTPRHHHHHYSPPSSPSRITLQQQQWTRRSSRCNRNSRDGSNYRGRASVLLELL